MSTLRETEELTSKSNEDKRKDEGMQITIENEKKTLYENCNTEQKPYKSLAKYLEDESKADSNQINNLHRNIRTENNLKISRKLDFKPALKPEYKNPNISNMLKNTDDFKIENVLEHLNIVAQEFEQAQIEEKLCLYKQGQLIDLAYKISVTTSFDKSDDSKMVFGGMTEKEREIRHVYYKYVSIINKQGRSIKDIYKIDIKKILEIFLLDDKSMYEEIENYLKVNKVSIPDLKRAIFLMNLIEGLDIAQAVEQAKKESKLKRADVKSGNKMQQNYKKLKLRLKYANKSLNSNYETNKINRKEIRKLTYRNNKQAKEIDNLKIELKSYKKSLKKVQTFINKSTKNTEFITEIKTIINKQLN